MSVCYGSNVTLPCTIDVASPSPLYYWERTSLGGSSSEINRTLSDGSLQLQNIQQPGIYQCTARNDYGSSVQIIELSKCLFMILQNYVLFFLMLQKLICFLPEIIHLN